MIKIRHARNCFSIQGAHLTLIAGMAIDNVFVMAPLLCTTVPSQVTNRNEEISLAKAVLPKLCTL